MALSNYNKMFKKKNMEAFTGIEDTVDFTKWNRKHLDYEEIS